MKLNHLLLAFFLVRGLAPIVAPGHTTELNPNMSRSTGTMPAGQAPVPAKPTATATSDSTADPKLALGFASRYGGLAPGAATQTEVSGTVVPENLRCEYRKNPLGIDALEPRLSWIIRANDAAGSSRSARGVRQTAYQVLVASSLDTLAKDQGDLWSSGKVVTDQSIQVEYADKQLATSRQYFWKARVWDQNGKQSAWSQPASWTMGILDPADWKGQWIKQPQDPSLRLPLFRKSFSIAKPLLRRALHLRLGLHGGACQWSVGR